MPALSTCTESPLPGCSATSVVSAISAISISDCPTPTVSTMMTSLPNASMSDTASAVAPETPPKCPRLAIERMNTSGSTKCSVSRMRSPSSAPCENGELGSTEMTPTVLPEPANERDERRATASICRPRAVRSDRSSSRVRFADTGPGSDRLAVARLAKRNRAGERALLDRRRNRSAVHPSAATLSAPPFTLLCNGALKRRNVAGRRRDASDASPMPERQ